MAQNEKELEELNSVIEKFGKALETQIYILEQLRTILKKLMGLIPKKEE
jgi:hypothetical protein